MAFRLYLRRLVGSHHELDFVLELLIDSSPQGLDDGSSGCGLIPDLSATGAHKVLD